MRDVGIVSFVYSAVAKDAEHNEVEMIVPVLREAVAHSGIPRNEIGFTCSGSLDYLQGGPFAFVDRGRHQLKGLPEPIELFAVTAP